MNDGGSGTLLLAFTIRVILCEIAIGIDQTAGIVEELVPEVKSVHPPASSARTLIRLTFQVKP